MRFVKIVGDTMKLRSKLIVSNIIAMLIAVATMLIVTLILAISFRNVTGISLEKFKESQNDIREVERYIDQTLNRMEYSQSLENRNMIYSEMDNYLRNRGYEIQLIQNGKIIDSNMSDENKKFLESINYNMDTYKNSNILQIDNKNIIKKNFHIEDSERSILAVGNMVPYQYVDMDFVLKTAITYLALFVFMSISMFFVTNIALTGYLSRYILNPIYRLKYGTEKIRKEDYKYTIKYDEKNEFGEVITEFNDMKEKLRASVEQQKNFDEDRKQLIVGISHDLRTPMTSIKGYAKGLMDGIANTPEKQEKYLKTIYTKTEELENLIEILYSYSRLESGSMRFNFEEIDFIGFMIEEVKNMVQEYDGRNISINYVGIINRQIMVSLDKTQFIRVLFNMVENSCKYAGEGVKIRFRTYLEKEYICLEVKDNGPGVKEESLDKIFEVFYRADSSRTDPGKSSGLGLSIVKRVVEGHGGTIAAHNDNGLVITIKLPRRSE